MNDRKYEFLIVGSGAGGGTLAKELSQRGKEVLVLERGRLETKLGSFADSARYYDVRSSVVPMPRTSKEGVIVWHTFQAGGSTVVSCANGVRCLEKELGERGVDIAASLDEAVADARVAPIAESLLSPGSQALRDAAQSLGYRMDNMPKFINPALCKQCGACVMGCRYGAKWTAAKSVGQAKNAGAEILYGTRVENVAIENGRAVGVDAIGPDGRRRVLAKSVIIAAGGLATPALLQRSGIAEAGRELFIDCLVNVYGATTGLNLANEPTMSLVDLEFHEDKGFLISPFVNHSRRVRFAELGLRGYLASDGNLLGLMIKIRDDSVGGILPDGSFSKVVTAADQKKLDDGTAIAKEILTKAGVAPGSLMVSKIQGGHPGGGAAIGTVIDENMQTKVDGLFVCDSSALPVAPGLPPILTIVALAKRLAVKLAA